MSRKQNTPEDVVLSLVESTETRVPPKCPHFGSCGGCQLQHVPYEAQLLAKQAMLLDVLGARGVHDVPEMVTHSASPWGYRNRIRLRIEGDAIGYSRRESNAFLPVETCPIASPLLERVAFQVRDLVRLGAVAWPAGAVAFELFTDADEQAVQMMVHLRETVGEVDREAPAQLRRMCERVQQGMPQLAGAGLTAAAPQAEQSKRVQATHRVEIARWGEPALTYSVGTFSYAVTRTAFFQVNRFLTGEMVETVVGNRAGRLVYDLFAGAGLFSLPLTGRFDAVVAVEVGEAAASDLRRHLAAAGASHRAVQATTQAFLERETRRPDLVVLDPPRAGVSRAALRALGRLRAEEMVYVSCDAGTFARDAKTLLESGYTLAALHLFDLFPQTVHTETVAVFRHSDVRG